MEKRKEHKKKGRKKETLKENEAENDVSIENKSKSKIQLRYCALKGLVTDF